MNVTYPWIEAPAAEFAVIGDPVTHSLSPLMHGAAYRKLGLPYRYVAIHVVPGQVAAALDRLRTLGYRGVNVTVPHKEEALAWAEDVEPLAARVRAANTLRLADQSCINTDAPGFLVTLLDFHPKEKTALLLGAGGSARAIAVALLGAGYSLSLYNRTFSKALSLAEELGIPRNSVLQQANPSGAALLVNTTSASLNNDELPILWDMVEPETLAYDLMYSKMPTPFLKSAALHKLATLDGLRMLVAQGARSFEWWLGLPAPRDAMLEAIL